jgi:hypothetical protein
MLSREPAPRRTRSGRHGQLTSLKVDYALKAAHFKYLERATTAPVGFIGPERAKSTNQQGRNGHAVAAPFVRSGDVAHSGDDDRGSILVGTGNIPAVRHGILERHFVSEALWLKPAGTGERPVDATTILTTLACIAGLVVIGSMAAFALLG